MLNIEHGINRSKDFLSKPFCAGYRGIHQMADKLRNASDPKDIIKKAGFGLSAATAIGFLALAVNLAPREVYANGWPGTATPTFTLSPTPTFTPSATPTFTKPPDFLATRVASARETLVAVLDQKRKEQELEDLRRQIAEVQAGPTSTPTPAVNFRETVTALLEQFNTEKELAELRRQIEALQGTPVPGQTQNLTINQILAILEREVTSADARVPAKPRSAAEATAQAIDAAVIGEIASRGETHTAVAKLSVTPTRASTPTPSEITVPKPSVQERDWGTVILVAAAALVAGGVFVALGDRRHWW